MPSVSNNNLVITWSLAMVQEVAHSYQQHPNLGFAAFEKSEAYTASKQKLSLVAEAKSPEVIAYLYVDYLGGNVVIQDLLGQPAADIRAKAQVFLHALGCEGVPSSQGGDSKAELCKHSIRPPSKAKNFPFNIWSASMFSRTFMLMLVVQCVAYLLKKLL